MPNSIRLQDDWEERLLKRDEEWKIRLGELELEVEQGGVREIKLKEEILNLEEQIKQSSLRNQSITGKVNTSLQSFNYMGSGGYRSLRSQGCQPRWWSGLSRRGRGEGLILHFIRTISEAPRMLFYVYFELAVNKWQDPQNGTIALIQSCCCDLNKSIMLIKLEGL